MLTPDEQSTFDAAVQSFFAGYEQEDGCAGRKTEDGRQYVEILASAAPMGAEREVLHMTLDHAIAEWLRNMTAYLQGKRRITWRIRPEADGREDVFFLDVMSPDFSFKPFKPIYRVRKNNTASILDWRQTDA